MPFIRLTPFLQNDDLKKTVKNLVCQCPSSGLLHFYIKGRIRMLYTTSMCQCPSSGLLHFYRVNNILTERYPQVSMPFIRLTPFLHRRFRTQTELMLMCQCPSSGLLHFYYNYFNDRTNKVLCQCPSSGLLHFYGTLWNPSVYAASQTCFCK